jgi:flagellar FliJ protein
MRKFRFKLQTVLDQRKSKEDRLLGELGQLRRQEAEEIEKLAALRREFHNACVLIEEGLRDKLDPGELERRDDYARACHDDIRVQELTLAAIREKIEAKREEVVKARREKRVLETLRDKQEREYVLAAERAEQNTLDEMASLRYARGL